VGNWRRKWLSRLPEAERRAIQFDLTFIGGFSGAASGNFGTLTFNAILAFERGAKLNGDGILTVSERQLLAAEASKARQSLKYAIISDVRSGARIGVPQAVLTRSEPNTSGGSRWQNADGRITLDTRVAPVGDTLAQLFEKATAPSTSGRKVTYKLLRPDFYAVRRPPESSIRGFRKVLMDNCGDFPSAMTRPWQAR
jgi:hypothetical protein